MTNRPAKTIASCLSVVYFLTQCALAHMPETGFWAERRRASKGRADALTLAGFPGTATSASFLPRITGGETPPLLSVPRSIPGTLPPRFVEDHAALLNALSPAHGSVRKIYLPKNVAPSRIVLHIQDVHQNAEAQKNIAAAVRSVLEASSLKGGRGRFFVDVVALEGAFGPIPMEPFRTYGNPPALRKVADYMLRENKISGPVHAGMTGTGALPPFLGVDDRALYGANVDAYRRSIAVEAKARKSLAALREDLSRRLSSSLAPDLLRLLRDLEAYREGKRTLSEHVRAVAEAAGGKPGAQVSNFLQALDLETAMDLPRVERERARLAETLVDRLSPADADKLLRWSAAYRLGEMRNGDFYRALQSLCRDAGVSLAAFPAMDSYVRYALLADRIDAEALEAELASLESASLARRTGDTRLLRQSKALSLLGKLLDFSLTPSEWTEYQSLRHELSLKDFPLEPFETFYIKARARDAALSQNLLRERNKFPVTPSLPHSLSPSVLILVTGGFHAPGLAEELTRRGAAVISYVPKIEKVDASDGPAYLSAFTQDKTPLDKLFEGEKLFVSPHPAPVAALAEAAYTHGALELSEGANDLLKAHAPSWATRVDASVDTVDGARNRLTLRFYRREANTPETLPPPPARRRAGEGGNETLVKTIEVLVEPHGDNIRAVEIREVGGHQTVIHALTALHRLAIALLAPSAALLRSARFKDLINPHDIPRLERPLLLLLRLLFGPAHKLVFLNLHRQGAWGERRSLGRIAGRLIGLEVLSRSIAESLLTAWRAHETLFPDAPLSIGADPSPPAPVFHPAFPGFRCIVNLNEVGNELEGDHITTRQGVPKARTLLPELAEMGIGEIYLNQGLFAPGDLGKKVHTRPDSGVHFARGANTMARVSGYEGKHEERTVTVEGQRRTLRLGDFEGNNFSIDMEELNPKAFAAEDSEGRWQELREFCLEARDKYGMRVIVDLVPWPSPDVLAKSPDAYKMTKDPWEIDDRDPRIDEQLLDDNPDRILLRVPDQNGKRRRVLVKKHWVAVDQALPDLENPLYRDYLLRVLRRLVEHEVGGVRVDLVQDLFIENNPHNDQFLNQLFSEINAYARERAKALHRDEDEAFLVDTEAYGAFEGEMSHVAGVNRAYFMGLFHILKRFALRQAHLGDFRDLMREIGDEKTSDRIRKSIQASNQDEPGLLNMGIPVGPLVGFLASESVTKGLNFTFYMRDLLNRKGELLPQAGGQGKDYGGAYNHPFDPKPEPGWKNFLRHFHESPHVAMMKDLAGLKSKSLKWEPLDSYDPNRYYGLGVRMEDGSIEIRVFDFFPAYGRPERLWVSSGGLGVKPELGMALVKPDDAREKIQWDDNHTGFFLPSDRFNPQGIARFRLERAEEIPSHSPSVLSGFEEELRAGRLPILALDLDDTLNRGFGQPIDPVAEASLQAYQAAGGAVGLNIGAPLDWAWRNILSHSHRPFPFMILGNGREIYVWLDTLEAYYRLPLEGRDKAEGLRLLADFLGLDLSRFWYVGDFPDSSDPKQPGIDDPLLTLPLGAVVHIGQTRTASLLPASDKTSVFRSPMPEGDNERTGVAQTIEVLDALTGALNREPKTPIARGDVERAIIGAAAKLRLPQGKSPVAAVLPFGSTQFQKPTITVPPNIPLVLRFQTRDEKHLDIMNTVNGLLFFSKKRPIPSLNSPGLLHAGVRDAKGDWVRTYEIPLTRTPLGIWEARILDPDVNAFTFLWHKPEDKNVHWQGRDFEIVRQAPPPLERAESPSSGGPETPLNLDRISLPNEKNVLTAFPQFRLAIEEWTRDRKEMEGPQKPSLTQSNLMERIGRFAGLDGNVLYYPFGGFALPDPFSLAPNGTDAISWGKDSFGSPQNIYNLLKSEPFEKSLFTSGGNFSGYDSTVNLEQLPTGRGLVAILKAIFHLQAEVVGIYYFILDGDGTPNFHSTINGKTQAYNAVVEIFDSASSRRFRFWYLQHKVESDDPSFAAFLRRIVFDGAILKAAEPLDRIGLEPDWVVNDIFEPIVRQAKGTLVVDQQVNENGERGSLYSLWTGPDPTSAPGKFPLNSGEQFGYSNGENDHVSFGPFSKVRRFFRFIKPDTPQGGLLYFLGGRKHRDSAWWKESLAMGGVGIFLWGLEALGVPLYGGDISTLVLLVHGLFVAAHAVEWLAYRAHWILKKSGEKGPAQDRGPPAVNTFWALVIALPGVMLSTVGLASDPAFLSVLLPLLSVPLTPLWHRVVNYLTTFPLSGSAWVHAATATLLAAFTALRSLYESSRGDAWVYLYNENHPRGNLETVSQFYLNDALAFLGTVAVYYLLLLSVQLVLFKKRGAAAYWAQGWVVVMRNLLFSLGAYLFFYESFGWMFNWNAAFGNFSLEDMFLFAAAPFLAWEILLVWMRRLPFLENELGPVYVSRRQFWRSLRHALTNFRGLLLATVGLAPLAILVTPAWHRAVNQLAKRHTLKTILSPLVDLLTPSPRASSRAPIHLDRILLPNTFNALTHPEGQPHRELISEIISQRDDPSGKSKLQLDFSWRMNLPNIKDPQTYGQFLRRLGDRIGALITTVYLPFGGFDLYTPFSMFPKASDAISWGKEGFGSGELLYECFHSYMHGLESGGVWMGYDGSNPLESVKAPGILALLKTMVHLRSRVKGVYYFKLAEKGDIEFLEPHDEAAGANAVVEILDPLTQRTFRFWYIKHDVYTSDESAFQTFLVRLQFNGAVLKGAHPLRFGNKSLWVDRDIIEPMKRQGKGFLMSDREQGDSGDFEDPCLPYPLWQGADPRKAPQEIVLEPKEVFGYSWGGPEGYRTAKGNIVSYGPFGQLREVRNQQSSQRPPHNALSRVENRLVQIGYANKALVESLIRVRDNVNPQGKPHRSVYLGAGVDISSIKIALNPMETWMLGNYRHLNPDEVKRVFSEAHMPQDSSSMKMGEIFPNLDARTLTFLSSAVSHKLSDSHFYTYQVDKPDYQPYLIATELIALGIQPKAEYVSGSLGNVTITFPFLNADKNDVFHFVNVFSSLELRPTPRSYPEDLAHLRDIDSVFTKASDTLLPVLPIHLAFWVERMREMAFLAINNFDPKHRPFFINFQRFQASLSPLSVKGNSRPVVDPYGNGFSLYRRNVSQVPPNDRGNVPLPGFSPPDFRQGGLLYFLGGREHPDRAWWKESLAMGGVGIFLWGLEALGVPLYGGDISTLVLLVHGLFVAAHAVEWLAYRAHWILTKSGEKGPAQDRGPPAVNTFWALVIAAPGVLLSAAAFSPIPVFLAVLLPLSSIAVTPVWHQKFNTLVKNAGVNDALHRSDYLLIPSRQVLISLWHRWVNDIAFLYFHGDKAGIIDWLNKNMEDKSIGNNNLGPRNYVLERISAAFDVYEPDDSKRHQKAEIVLDIIAKYPFWKKWKILNECRDSFRKATWHASGTHRYMPLALTIVNLIKGRDIFSDSIVKEMTVVDIESIYLTTTHLLYGNPKRVIKRLIPLHRPSLTINTPRKTNFRYLDVGAAFHSQGAPPLNYLKTIFKALLPEKEFEFFATDIFSPPYQFQNGAILETPFKLKGFRERGVVKIDGIEYCDANRPEFDFTSPNFNLGKFDFISLCMMFHHLAGRGENIVHTYLGPEGSTWIDENGDKIRPAYKLTSRQWGALNQLLNSLTEDGGLLFLNLTQRNSRREDWFEQKNGDLFLIIRREGENQFRLYRQAIPFHPTTHTPSSVGFVMETTNNLVYVTPGFRKIYEGAGEEFFDTLKSWLEAADILVYRHQERDGSFWIRLLEMCDGMQQRKTLRVLFELFLKGVPDNDERKIEILKGVEEIEKEFLSEQKLVKASGTNTAGPHSPLFDIHPGGLLYFLGGREHPDRAWWKESLAMGGVGIFLWGLEALGVPLYGGDISTLVLLVHGLFVAAHAVEWLAYRAHWILTKSGEKGPAQDRGPPAVNTFWAFVIAAPGVLLAGTGLAPLAILVTPAWHRAVNQSVDALSPVVDGRAAARLLGQGPLTQGEARDLILPRLDTPSLDHVSPGAAFSRQTAERLREDSAYRREFLKAFDEEWGRMGYGPRNEEELLWRQARAAQENTDATEGEVGSVLLIEEIVKKGDVPAVSAFLSSLANRKPAEGGKSVRVRLIPAEDAAIPGLRELAARYRSFVSMPVIPVDLAASSLAIDFKTWVKEEGLLTSPLRLAITVSAGVAIEGDAHENSVYIRALRAALSSMPLRPEDWRNFMEIAATLASNA